MVGNEHLESGVRRSMTVSMHQRVSQSDNADPLRTGRKRRRSEDGKNNALYASSSLMRDESPQQEMMMCPRCPRRVLPVVWLALMASLSGLVVQAPMMCAALFVPLVNVRRHPQAFGVQFYPTRPSPLQASSIKTWFSMVNTPKQDTPKANKKKEPIFFKRNPSRHNESKPDDSNPIVSLEGKNVTSPRAMDSSVTTWANLLSDDDNAPLALVDDTSATTESTKRQAIQNGIFDPTSTLWHFPEYTSAWANTFSMTLQNSTHHSCNKVAAVPLVFSPNATARPSLSIPAHLKPEDTLTVADLQAILQGNSPDATSWAFSGTSPKTSSKKKTISAEEALLPTTSSSIAAPTSQSGKTKQGVAFPQASVLNYKSLRRGTAFASGITGMILSTTLLPNLWLMGLLVGGIYGYDLCSRPDEPPPSNLVARTLIQWGRVLATAVLSVTDSCRTLWFLYKTGELSYQYYKSYEVMDQRFAIQAKMDAWNARFQEGKLKFDQWERDNEIGRTVLAGLRTVWLVDERNRRRAQKSRYRVVQSLYDGKYWVTRWTRKTWKRVLTSNSSASLQEYWKGIRTDLMHGGGSSWGTRLRAIVASLIAVNITGALFAISPTFLAILAVAVGIAWPSWLSELTNRLDALSLETRARGRGDDSALQQLLATATRDTNTAKLLGRYDKEKYHYFRREDGTKRYYRTGQSLFTGRRKKNTPKIQKTTALLVPGTANTFAWPWSKPQRVRRPPGKEQWGLFSR